MVRVRDVTTEEGRASGHGDITHPFGLLTEVEGMDHVSEISGV